METPGVPTKQEEREPVAPAALLSSPSSQEDRVLSTCCASAFKHQGYHKSKSLQFTSHLKKLPGGINFRKWFFWEAEVDVGGRDRQQGCQRATGTQQNQPPICFMTTVIGNKISVISPQPWPVTGLWPEVWLINLGQLTSGPNPALARFESHLTDVY